MKLVWKRIRKYALAAVVALGAGCGLFLIGTGGAFAYEVKWAPVGGAGFSAGEAWEPSLFIDNGTPYAAYIEGNVDTVTVKKYNGSSWETVGSPISGASSASWYTALYVDSGTPYIAYIDRLNSDKVSVKKFNGSSWELVGNAGISANFASFISLYVDNGIPYVAFKDLGNAGKATVMKYVNSNWETVGSAGFSAGQIYGLTLLVDNGTPYVSYQDGANASKATVMKYNGTGWETVGNAGFTPGRADYTRLYIDQGIPYVAIMDFWNGGKATVMKYNGSGWETVGNAGFSANTADYPSLFVDQGTPYIAFKDGANSSRATVMKYNGSSWETVATPGFSVGTAEFVSLEVYNGIPYVLYRDLGLGSKVTLTKLKFTVAYEGNGSTGGTVPTDGNSYDKNTAAAVLGNTGNLVRTGYTFAGWNTAADGNGTTYAPGDAVNVGATGIRLYARWTANSYAVTYDGNGAASGSPPAGGSYVYNTGITLPGNTGSLVRTGYTFAGWNTAANGSGTNYPAGSTYTIGAAPVTLYAKWTINSYTVAYDSNGAASGSVPPGGSHNYNTSVTVSGNTGGLAKTGYTFVGWNTAADGNGTNYVAANTFTIGAANVTLYAKWTVNSYTVTYDGNGSDGGTVPGSSSHDYNTGFAVPNNSGGLVKTGHTFAGWNTSADGSGTNYAESAPYTMGAANVTLYAQWTVNNYNVTYDGNGASTGSAPAGGSHDYNTSVTVQGNSGALEKTGHTFAGWNTAADGSGTNFAESDTFTIGAANVMLYAQWTINSYAVTYEGNGATSGDVPADSNHMYNSSVTVPGNPGSLAKTGHTFAGWNTAADGSGTTYAESDTFTILAADVTLYAKWTVNQYSVTFESNGGTPTTGQTIDYGASVVEPSDPTKTGYTFAGWFADPDLTAAYDFSTPIEAADMTLYAKWTINSYTVTYDGNGSDGGTVPGSGSHDYNTSFAVSGNSGGLVKTGHTFAGWNTSADGNGTNYAEAETYTILAANVTLYAKWTVNGYTVTYDGNGATSGSAPAVSSHDYNTSVTVQGNSGALEKTGHTFAGWNTAADGSGTDYTVSDTFTIGAADVTLYAKWTIDSYDVTYVGNGAESGSVPADSSHVYNTVVTVPGNPGGLTKTGHAFAGWSTAADGSGTAYAAGESFTIGAADVTLYAKWTVNQYTVSFESNGGTPTASQSIPYGGTASEPSAPTKTGHTFAGWHADEDLTATYDFATPVGAADLTLYAKWTIDSYTVTYDGNGAESGSVPAGGSHVYNTVVTVPGNPGGLAKTGYTFAGWNTASNGSGTSYADADSFTIGAGDITLYAKWTANEYTIGFESNGGSTVDGVTVRYGSAAVKPSDPTKTGYAFAGWYTDRDTLSQAFDFAAPIGAADVTLYAKWLSANALLSGLSVDQGTLRPAFSPSNPNYVVDAAKSVTSLNLFLRKGDPTQSITVTGATYASVTDDVYAYDVSSLVVGPNSIAITVTAENQDQNTYNVTVNVSADEAIGQPVALDPSVRTLTFPGGLKVRLPDGLSIPPGATLTVRNSNAAPPGEVKLGKAGQVIDFQFEGVTIDRPVEITLGYDDNSDSNKLAIFYFNEATGKWEYQPSYVTDNGIKASVSHFSTYGVLADPAAPDRVTVSAGEKTTSSITLHLAANDDSGVAKYLIYRDGTLVAETAESTYADTGLSASRTYVYTVKAVDRLGNISNDSEAITIATIGSGSSGGNGGGGGSGGVPPSADKVASTDGALTLPAGKAGEVRMGDEVKIVIPAGAFDEELKLTIERVTDVRQLIGSADMLLSPVFEILKDVAENFSKEVALTFAFDPTKIADTQKPSVFFYDESKRVWVEIGGEANGNTITASVNHFTKFAVFAVDKETDPSPEEKPTIRFSDIAGHWAESSIRAAAAAGIVNGYADGTFQPNTAVTRAEFAAMLMKALKTQGTGLELSFADTAEIGAWATTAVAQAVEAGIVAGYEDGRFRPAANITRAELAVMIARALGADIETGSSPSSGFADDADIPIWAKGAVSAVRQSGIVQGRSGNRFAPDATATRAEAVTMIMNLLQKMN